MEAPNLNQRLRRVPWVSSSSSDQSPNPRFLPSVPDFSQNHVDLVISSFLSLPDFPSLTSSQSISCSFERALDKLLESSADESAQNLLNDRGLQLASLLHESTERCFRKRDTIRNSISWPFPDEVTIQVFSMLDDTKSLMRASACCTMFNKCAMKTICFANINLTTKNVKSRVVRSMILMAGKELRSLKVGYPDPPTRSLLSGSCLAPLAYKHGFIGNHLRSLHIYNDRWLGYNSLSDALRHCLNLTDLMIVGLTIDLSQMVTLLPGSCEHLSLEKEYRSGGKSTLIIRRALTFTSNCPNLTSLSLIGFDLSDETACLLIKGFRKLKYMNLSRADRMRGSFLRDVSSEGKDSLLETLILRDCYSLEERNVCWFFDSLLGGDFRFVRHIVVSNGRGGLKFCGSRSTSKPKLPLKELKKARPGLTLVAEFRSPSSSSPSVIPFSSTSSSSSSSSSAAARFLDYFQ